MRVALVTSSVVLALFTGCGNGIGISGPTFGGSSGSVGVGGSVVSVGSGPIGPGGTFDEAVVVPASRPPAISGGTLLLIAQGRKAAVADPERDHVVIVDIDQLLVTATIPLQKGDEPGRLIEDGRGLLHVALRGSGAVATLDPVAGKEVGRVNVCTHPRGLAYDATADTVHVACAGGELVSLAATSGTAVRQLKLDRDLRDVVIDGDHLLVSRFRAAELLIVEADGHVSGRLSPQSIAPNPNAPPSPPPGTPGSAGFSPAVAWRTIAAPGGGAIMSFQEEQTTEVQIQPGGYGSFCGGIVRGAVSLLRVDGAGWTTANTSLVLPVDVAVSSDLSQIAIAGAGNVATAAFGITPPVVVVPPPPPGVPADPSQGGCQFGPGDETTLPKGQVVAVALDASRRLLVQTREPMLIVGDRALVLPGDVIRDTGHEIFHLGTMGGLACASCHPEGLEDGHTWTFAGLGARRTQSLGGGALGTGPFHWSGDIKDFLMLSQEVFKNRMSGPELRGEHVQALTGWIDRVPAWKPTVASDPAAAERGRALFNDSTVGCTSCHSGQAMTTHAIVDVGTGAPFKVPSLLGVGFRAPYMHNGCAATLADRFGACGGDEKHGHASSLTEVQRADLVSYLGTL